MKLGAGQARARASCMCCLLAIDLGDLSVSKLIENGLRKTLSFWFNLYAYAVSHTIYP